jgi:hypothetical protein
MPLKMTTKYFKIILKNFKIIFYRLMLLLIEVSIFYSIKVVTKKKDQ